MKEIIKSTFYANLQRVRDLAQISLALQNIPSPNSLLYSEDVLRSSIVLMHATIEDLLRGLYRWIIPNRGQEQWNKIPLKGINDKNQPKSFLLGSLYNYKDLTVAEVITESVDEYLNYTNYNKTQDIVSLCTDINVSIITLQQFFPSIEEMMKRRHNIVHRADRLASLESTDHTLQEITYSQVVTYLENLSSFGEAIFKLV